MPYRDPEQAKAYRREYYLKNKDKINEYNHKRYQDCKEKRREYARKRYQEFKEDINTRNCEYCKNHKEERKVYFKKHDQARKFPYHNVLIEAGRERVCELCGATENVHTHHKDLNHDNNELSNLQWLCGSCHSKLHAELRRKRE